MKSRKLDSADGCLACGGAMRFIDPWVRRCGACAFMISTLAAGPGRGVAGLKSLRLQNFETILDRIDEFLPPKDGRLLEVGCAQGWFLECAARRGLRTEGIEPELDTANLAEAARLGMVSGYFPAALRERVTYDVIVFNDVFEHLSNPAEAIIDIEQRLEPGGLLVLNLPSSNGVIFAVSRWLQRLGVSAPYERLWQKGMASPHLTYFNPPNLRGFVERRTELRRLFAGRLKVLHRRGLWRRLRSTYPATASAAIFLIAWLASFALDWLPSDAQLAIFKKP